MIRIVYVFHRRKDISRKKCHSYWKDIHAQKVKEHADVLGITGYAQLHTTGSAFFNWMMRKFRKTMPCFDGTAEYWIDKDKMAAALETEDGKKAMVELVDDEKQFIDHSRSSIFLAREHLIIDNYDGKKKKPVQKLTWVGSPLDNLTPEQFQDHYLNMHAPLVKDHMDVLGVERYFQVHTFNDPLNETLRSMRGTIEPFLVHAEFIWDFKNLFTSEARLPMKDIAEDEKRFINFLKSAIWRADEYVIF